jgi:glycosyltransferase involved in cell wall biosynthesis
MALNREVGPGGREPRVSIVVPFFNAEETLARALESAGKCLGVGELIAVDDGSRSDDGSRIAEAFGRSAPFPVFLVRQENSGPAAARNRGIGAASLDWIGFLDADDELLPDGISARLSHLALCPDSDTVTAVYGGFQRDDTGRPQPFAITTGNVVPDRIGCAGGFPGGAPAYLFRRRALMASGGFNESLRLFEDFEFLLRLLRSGARIVGTDRPGFIRHYTEGSLTRLDRRKSLAAERAFLRRAASDGLLGRVEIVRRYGVNAFKVLRQSFQ